MEIPARVLQCFVTAQTGLGAWPWNDGTPYWEFGTTPRDYRWQLTLNVTPQSHSSVVTRVARLYTGMDIKVGDWIASIDGIALRITEIVSKTDAAVVCVVEDIQRYNTFRDPSGIGNGMFNVPGDAVVFELNQAGRPVIDPLPPSASPQFYSNLISRFQDTDKSQNFQIDQANHGFALGQIVSADLMSHSFKLTSDAFPYVIGQVSWIGNPDVFLIDPVQQIVDQLDSLPGDIGDIIYANAASPGNLTLAQSANPVMIKLRRNTQSVVTSVISNASTFPGAIMAINGVDHTVGGTGSLNDLANAVNTHTVATGVSGQVVLTPTVVSTSSSLLNGQFGEPLFSFGTGTYPSATINGALVTFTTHTDGTARYGGNYGTAVDMAADINAAMANSAYSNVVAIGNSTSLTISETTGKSITIVNQAADAAGHVFAGANSAAGLAMQASSSTSQIVQLTAVDARAIDLANVLGSPVEDFGLFSVENGIKAAAALIENGLRQSVTTVVPNIAGRNALYAILGDQAYVLDKGNGTWGLYLYDGSAWKLLASQESANSAAGTYVANATYAAPGTIAMGEVAAGAKVTLITAEVTQAFDGSATLTLGDAGQLDRLAAQSDFNLGVAGVYVVNPTVFYGVQTLVEANLLANGCTQGSVVISVSFQ